MSALGALSLSLSLSLASLGGAEAKPWAPTPPCAAPLGVDEPAVAESMCSLALARAGDIVVREMGLPASATLAAVHVDSTVFYDALSVGVQSIVQYFVDNKILAARTTPIAVRDLSDNNLTYVVSMMVSTAAYPDAAKIPPPQLPVQLETVGQRSVAAVQFNTTQPPVEADFAAACSRLLNGKLPKGYAFDMASSWSPTYVLYNGEAATFFTSECWAEVVKGAAADDEGAAAGGDA